MASTITLEVEDGDGCHLWFSLVTERDRIEGLVTRGVGTDGRSLTADDTAILRRKVERLMVLEKQAFRLWHEELARESS